MVRVGRVNQWPARFRSRLPNAERFRQRPSKISPDDKPPRQAQVLSHRPAHMRRVHRRLESGHGRDVHKVPEQGCVCARFLRSTARAGRRASCSRMRACRGLRCTARAPCCSAALSLTGLADCRDDLRQVGVDHPVFRHGPVDPTQYGHLRARAQVPSRAVLPNGVVHQAPAPAGHARPRRRPG
jgi:hypothetical protein